MTREQTIIDTREYFLGVYGLLQNTGRALLPRERLTDRRKMAGVVRTVTGSVINDVGGAAVQASNEVYRELRREAGVTSGFEPATPQSLSTPENVDPIVGDFIKKSYGEGATTDPAYSAEVEWVRDQVSDAVFDSWLFSVEKTVGNIFRNNIASNVARDRAAIGYQRIARPNACTFCRVVALNVYTSFEQDGGYHKNCACYAVPIFQGQSPYYPEYYEDFERQYNEYKDKAPPEGYQSRSIRLDDTAKNRAEIRRRETFRNIRANIEAETRDFPIPAPPTEAILKEIEPGKFSLGGNIYDMPVRGVTSMRDSLNNFEQAALNEYTNTGYAPINQGLRDGILEPLTGDNLSAGQLLSNEGIVGQLDSALSKSITTDEITVLRGMPVEALIPEIPGMGPASQLRYSDPDGVTWFLRQFEGRTLSDAGYMSTSMKELVNPDIAALTYGTSGIVFEINVPPGTQALDVFGSDLADTEVPVVLAREQELLLPRNTKLRVNRVLEPGEAPPTGSPLADQLRGQSWTILAEVVND